MSAVAPVILGFLQYGPRSGYEIKAAVDRSTRYFWAASYGQIYPELRQLERDGLVVGEDMPTGGRRRTVYSLTDSGRDALVAWLRDPDVGYQARDVGLLKLFFSDSLSRDEMLELVRAVRADRERILEHLLTIEAGLGERRGGSRRLVLEYGIEFHRWFAAWCERVERQLSAGRRPRKKEGARWA